MSASARRFSRRRILGNAGAIGIAGALLPVASACSGLTSGDDGNSNSGGKVSATSWSGTASTNKAILASQEAVLALFKTRYPDIAITLTKSTGGPDTLKLLPAKFAGGQLETHFAVPLASAYIPIDQRQTADITSVIKGWKHFGELNPGGIEATSRDGKIFGFVDFTNTSGLVYNRKMFKAAGLDPDNPPKTWDDFREAAKKLAKPDNGIFGFGIEGGLAGGWRHVQWSYSAGARIQKKDSSGKWICDLTTPQGMATAKLWHDMRFTDRSFANKFYSGTDLAQDLVLGKVGMMIGAISSVSNFVGPNSELGIPVDDVGVGPLPQNGGNATYTNSTAELFNAKASADEIRAAFQYQSFKTMDPDAIEASMKAQKDNGATVNPLNTSALALKVDSPLRGEIESVVKKYTTVPDELLRPFLDGTKDFELIDEPPIQSQQVYVLLGTTTEAVLTNERVNIEAEMQKVHDLITSQLLKGAN